MAGGLFVSGVLLILRFFVIRYNHVVHAGVHTIYNILVSIVHAVRTILVVQ